MILECYNLLKLMEQRPAMWTGETSLRSIDSYIAGYYHALLDNKLVHEPGTTDHFFDWVANKLGYNESTAGWVNMILAHSMGFKPGDSWEEVLNTPVTVEQHSKSIKTFYELIEQFKNEYLSKIEN